MAAMPARRILDGPAVKRGSGAMKVALLVGPSYAEGSGISPLPSTALPDQPR